jgi:hypothetical protein
MHVVAVAKDRVVDPLDFARGLDARRAQSLSDEDLNQAASTKAQFIALLSGRAVRMAIDAWPRRHSGID